MHPSNHIQIAEDSGSVACPTTAAAVGRVLTKRMTRSHDPGSILTLPSLCCEYVRQRTAPVASKAAVMTASHQAKAVDSCTDRTGRLTSQTPVCSSSNAFQRSLGNGRNLAVWMVRTRVEVHTETGMARSSNVCTHEYQQTPVSTAGVNRSTSALRTLRAQWIASPLYIPPSTVSNGRAGCAHEQSKACVDRCSQANDGGSYLQQWRAQWCV